MAVKYHINAEGVVDLCEANVRDCIYAREPGLTHFLDRALAEVEAQRRLSSLYDPLGGHRSRRAPRGTGIREEMLALLGPEPFQRLQDHVDVSPGHWHTGDALVLERSRETWERHGRLRDMDPFNPTASHPCSRPSFEMLCQDHEEFRTSTAWLVEALGESPHFHPRYSTLDSPDRVGRAELVDRMEPNSTKWIRARHDSVGGSDVGFLALTDFGTPGERPSYAQREMARIERSKVVMVSDEEVATIQGNAWGRKGAMYRGHVWESRIRDGYARDHGGLVGMVKDQYVHPDRPWQKVNLDGVLLSTSGDISGLLEIKTAANPGKWEGRVPLEYRAQGLYYLDATGFDHLDIRVLIQDSEVRDYRLHRSEPIVPGGTMDMATYRRERIEPWFRSLVSRR